MSHYSPKEFSSQEHSAAVPQSLVQDKQDQEQPQDSRPVEVSNQDCDNKQDHHEGNYPGADDDTEVEKITNQELSEIVKKLREIPCTPAFKVNPQVVATIKKHPHNAPGAIAYLKEALRTWTRVDCPEAVFSKACKEGLKPENWGKPVVNHPQPSDEQLQQLKRAVSKREIRDLSKAPSGLWIVDTGTSILSWWEYLQVTI